MTKNKIAILLVTVLFGLGGCSKSFTDLKPYDSLPVEDALKTEADLSTALNGMYAGMRTSYISRTIPFIGDLLADNIYLSATNSGRYLQQSTYTTNAQNVDIRDTWTQLYTVILRANNIINAQVTESATVNQYKGEAMTIRALMYWELVKLYAKPYATNPSSPGVPIVLTYDATLRPARNSVQEVYTQIVSDLKSAFTMLVGTRPSSSYVTKYVAEALLSKVYLYEKDYTNGLAAAQDVITNGGYTLTTAANLNAYWANPTPVANKLETIFEVSLDGVANAGTDALAYIYSQSGYGDALATTDLYNLYSATDARKGLIVTAQKNKVDVLTVNKYQNTSNISDKDDIKILRYADVLLIAAESAARLGQEPLGLTYLNQLVKARDPQFAGYSSSGATLINDIITERRKELAFEGDRFDDLNRLGLDVQRNNQAPPTAQSLAVNDYRRVQPIPQVELDSNPQIKQNEGY